MKTGKELDGEKTDTMAELEAMRLPLEGQVKMKHSSSRMAEDMLALIDALQKAHRQSVFEEGLYEFIDAPLTMTESVYVQQYLLLAARHIAVACRQIINQPKSGDKDLLQGP